MTILYIVADADHNLLKYVYHSLLWHCNMASVLLANGYNNTNCIFIIVKKIHLILKTNLQRSSNLNAHEHKQFMQR